MFNKKIIISVVIFISLIIGITAFQYFKNDDVIELPPNEKFFPVIEDFECGDPVTFNYSGEIVSYGTVENPETGKCWMDRNLGALRVAEAFNDSEAYGDLYQWGRINDGHEKRNSEETTNRSDTDSPGHNKFIQSSDWRETPNDQLWQGENGINNPCPAGWQLPTANEWKEEMETWISKDRQGAYNSPLKLTVGGLRYNISADIVWEGRFGEYWSSSVGPNDTSLWLQFLDHEADIVTNLRSFGQSVRCVRAGEEKVIEESDDEKIKEELAACEVFQGNLLSECYGKLALAYQNPVICEKVNYSGIKDECYMNLAVLKQDKIICEGIEDEEERNNCYGYMTMLNKNIYLCEDIEDEEGKNLCYKNFALAKKDESICEKISGNRKYNIYGDCYSDVAVVKKDENICFKINIEDDEDEEYRESECLACLGITRRSLDCCDKAGERYKKNCYYYLAKLEKDESVCREIYVDEYIRNRCYTIVASEKKDKSICALIDDLEDKYSCYLNVAVEKQDESICDLINHLKLKINCYADVARIKQNLSVCDKIDDLSDEEVYWWHSNRPPRTKADHRQDEKNWCYGWASGEQDISLIEPLFKAPDNWVVYTNTEMNFEIKVPEATEISEGSTGKIGFRFPSDNSNPKIFGKNLTIKIQNMANPSFNLDAEEHVQVAGISFKKGYTDAYAGMETVGVAYEYYNKDFDLTTIIWARKYIGEPFDEDEESEIFRKVLSTFRVPDSFE